MDLISRIHTRKDGSHSPRKGSRPKTIYVYLKPCIMNAYFMQGVMDLDIDLIKGTLTYSNSIELILRIGCNSDGSPRETHGLGPTNLKIIA